MSLNDRVMKVTCVYSLGNYGWSDNTDGISYVMISHEGMPIVRGGVDAPTLHDEEGKSASLNTWFRCYGGELYQHALTDVNISNVFMKQAMVERLLRNAVRLIREEDIVITNFVEL